MKTYRTTIHSFIGQRRLYCRASSKSNARSIFLDMIKIENIELKDRKPIRSNRDFISWRKPRIKVRLDKANHE